MCDNTINLKVNIFILLVRITQAWVPHFYFLNSNHPDTHTKLKGVVIGGRAKIDFDSNHMNLKMTENFDESIQYTESKWNRIECLVRFGLLPLFCLPIFPFDIWFPSWIEIKDVKAPSDRYSILIFCIQLHTSLAIDVRSGRLSCSSQFGFGLPWDLMVFFKFLKDYRLLSIMPAWAYGYVFQIGPTIKQMSWSTLPFLHK